MTESKNFRREATPTDYFFRPPGRPRWQFIVPRLNLFYKLFCMIDTNKTFFFWEWNWINVSTFVDIRECDDVLKVITFIWIFHFFEPFLYI